MSEAPCNLLKLDDTGLHFYLSKMRWKTLRHLLFPNTLRNDNIQVQNANVAEPTVMAELAKCGSASNIANIAVRFKILRSVAEFKKYR